MVAIMWLMDCIISPIWELSSADGVPASSPSIDPIMCRIIFIIWAMSAPIIAGPVPVLPIGMVGNAGVSSVLGACG
jgi:hypothetical protein